MKNFYLLLLYIFSFGAFAQEAIVITDVSVIPISTNTVLEHRDIYIKKGSIEKIEAHKTLSKSGYRIINGVGKFVMPGLADMHVHLPDGGEPINLQQTYNYYLETGVTVLRSMRGEKWHPAHRDSINKGLIKAPKLYISNPLPHVDSLLTKKYLNEFISDTKKNKYDFVKYLYGVKEEKMLEVSKALKANGLTIAGHSYKDLATSIKLGWKSIEHVAPIMDAWKNDSLRFDKLLLEMKTNNVSFCPTESFSQIIGFQYSMEELMGRNGIKNVDTALSNAWKRDYLDYIARINKKTNNAAFNKQKSYTQREMEAYHPLLVRMIKANVNVLLSPDNCLFNVPGYSMLEEMKLYRIAGVSNYDILKCSTLNAANFFNESKKWGTVEPGKEATLIILDKNPLENIENISSVNSTFIKGKMMWERK